MKKKQLFNFVFLVLIVIGLLVPVNLADTNELNLKTINNEITNEGSFSKISIITNNRISTKESTTHLLAGEVCGQTITSSTVMDGDLIDCPNEGLIIGANNVVLDCDGYLIDGAVGTIFEAVVIKKYDNVTIKDCRINEFRRGIATDGDLTDPNNNIYIYNNTLTNIESSAILTNRIIDGEIINNTLINGTLVSGGYGIAVYGSNQENVTISNNNITNFNSGIAVMNILSDPATMYLTNNNLFSNINYNFEMKNAQITTINVPSNYWGTTDQLAINSKIYDYFDDNSLGKVNYCPFLDAPSPGGNPVTCSEQCGSGVDDDFNGNCDYDSTLCSHGDIACPIETTSISVSDTTPLPTDTLNVTCTVNVGSINSINVKVGSIECPWDSAWESDGDPNTGWNGNLAQFIGCDVGSAGTKDALCYVNLLKSYQTGSNKTIGITVLPPLNASAKKFNITDSSGSTVAYFDDEGNLVLKGTLTESGTPTPGANSEFIIQDTTGTPIVVIDSTTGNIVISGTVREGYTILEYLTEEEFMIKNSAGDIVTRIDRDGNLDLTGLVYENYIT